MNGRTAFGPNLRRVRFSRGISLDEIARVTNVPVPLWEAFEDNELSGWPSGVLARAFVTEYARLIGVDPDATVDEFCRLFPEGDRRRARVVGEVATLLGQPRVWTEDWTPEEERREPLRRARELRLMTQRQELAIRLLDIAVVAIVSGIAAIALRVPYPAAVLGVATLYYILSGMARASAGTRIVRYVQSIQANDLNRLTGARTRAGDRPSPQR